MAVTFLTNEDKAVIDGQITELTKEIAELKAPTGTTPIVAGIGQVIHFNADGGEKVEIVGRNADAAATHVNLIHCGENLLYMGDPVSGKFKGVWDGEWVTVEHKTAIDSNTYYECFVRGTEYRTIKPGTKYRAILEISEDTSINGEVNMTTLGTGDAYSVFSSTGVIKVSDYIGRSTCIVQSKSEIPTDGLYAVSNIAFTPGSSGTVKYRIAIVEANQSETVGRFAMNNDVVFPAFAGETQTIQFDGAEDHVSFKFFDVIAYDGKNTVGISTGEATVTRYVASENGGTDDPLSIPEYWVDAVSSKEQEVKNIIFNSAKNDNDIAVFFAITDQHYPSNTNVSTALMKYLSEKCGVGLTVCLGDIIEDSVISRDIGLERIHIAMTNLGQMSDRMILTQGNHDTNAQMSDSNGQITADRIIYDKEWVLHTSNKLRNLNRITFDALGKAFYYDDDVQKIRFISIDSFDGKSYRYTDGILTSFSLGGVTERQIDWLNNVALSDVPSDYSVITFSHYTPFSATTNTDSGSVAIPNGVMGNGTLVLQAISNFVSNGGNYIAHFAGHLHHDFISVNDGITSVHLLNDGLDWRKQFTTGDGTVIPSNAPKKNVGSVNECAFDVVIVNKTTRHVDLIRVGAGDNRGFDY